MKRIIFTLCFFLTFLISAYAGELYECIDHDGNSIITDIPQDGMKCDLKSDSGIDTVFPSNMKVGPSYKECMQELDTAGKYCNEVVKNYHSRLSPECSKLAEKKHKPKPQEPCFKEILKASLDSGADFGNCFDKRVSVKCKEILNPLSKSEQDSINQCFAAIKRVQTMCDHSVDENCGQKQDKELKAACGSGKENKSAKPAVLPDREMPLSTGKK